MEQQSYGYPNSSTPKTIGVKSETSHVTFAIVTHTMTVIYHELLQESTPYLGIYYAHNACRFAAISS